MLRLLSACLVVLSLVPLALAKDDPLKEARQRWLQGNYQEALEQYDKLADKDPIGAAIGISRCLESQGAYDKALEKITGLLKDHATNAVLLSRQAELLYLRGLWTEAEKAAEAAIKANAESFSARWVRAQIYRDRGELKKADAEFRWFVRTYSDRSEKERDIKDPEELLLVGLAGCENARWNNLSDQYEFILKEIYGDALKFDKDFWLAEYQAGMLLLEKYNRREGLPALDKALTINPNAAEALVGKGIAALQRMEIKDAERFAERALRVNPHLPMGLRLRADVYLATGDTGNALKELERARKINPRDEQTLGRMAACLTIQKKQEDFVDLTRLVEKNDPLPGVYYLVLGECLEERRYYLEAEKAYKKAIALRPFLYDARTHLGMLYMRLGREKEARVELDKAYTADPFNVRVSNTRKVLTHLDRYDTLKTTHFEIRFDAKKDAALAGYMAQELEKLHADLAQQFQHAPQGPILFEIFNNHEMFSGRVVALPDLHTIGACTGKMFAMVAPGGVGAGKKFNWMRVVRHELVHIFNLDQTNFLVPHWFTEGLAVSNEGFPRPQVWNDLLKERVASGDLLTLDTIDLAFIRPRSSLDWNMAYCQSLLYIQFLKEKYGPQTIGPMLNAYRDGLDTTQALSQVCKVDRATFEKGYRDYLQRIVKEMGGAAVEKKMTAAELKAAVEKDPDNVDLKARLAEAMLRRNRAEARKLARSVLDQDGKNARASYVLAQLALVAGDLEQARMLLERVVDRSNPDPKVALALGKMYYDAKEFPKAAEMFELGRKAEPLNRDWLLQLARVYAQQEDRDKQIEVLKALIPTDADDLEHRKRLARILLEKKDYADAERYARQSLEIDINDQDVRKILLTALSAQQKADEVGRLQKLFEK